MKHVEFDELAYS